MQITDTKPEDFINSLTESRADIQKLDKIISSIGKNEQKVMWEGVFWGGSDQKIIGYGKFTYTGSNKKTGEWFRVGLALQRNYITVFVHGFDKDKEGKIKYIAELYKDKLGKVKVGKSTVSFKKLEDVNLDVLKEVVKKSFE